MKPGVFPGEQVLRWQVHGPQQMLPSPVTQQSTFPCRRAATAGCPPSSPECSARVLTPGWPGAPHSETLPSQAHHPTLSLEIVSVRLSRKSLSAEKLQPGPGPPLLWVPVPEAHGPWTRVHFTHQTAALGLLSPGPSADS